MFEPYMFGTPDELMARARQGRTDQAADALKLSQAYDKNPQGYEAGPMGHNAAYFMKRP